MVSPYYLLKETRKVKIARTFCSYHNFIDLANKLLLPNVMSKILRELLGIRIAAINGDKFPCTANKRPIIL